MCGYHLLTEFRPAFAGPATEFAMAGCERETLVGRYHDGELPAGDRAGFEQHLAGCTDCTTALGRLKTLSDELAPLRRLRLPEGTRRRVIEAAESAGDTPGVIDRADKPGASRVWWVRWVTAAAAAVFLFSMVQLYLSQGGTMSGTGPGGTPIIQPQPRPAPPRTTSAPSGDQSLEPHEDLRGGAAPSGATEEGRS